MNPFYTEIIGHLNHFFHMAALYNHKIHFKFILFAQVINLLVLAMDTACDFQRNDILFDAHKKSRSKLHKIGIFQFLNCTKLEFFSF